VSALVNLGALNLNFGNIAKAQDYLDRAIWLDPGNARAYQYLGKVYRQKANQGNRRDMLLQRLDYLEKAYRIDPDNLQLTLSLGVGYCQLDKCAKAQPYLQDIKTGSKKISGESRQLYTNCLEKCR
jgi:tetratricopeptide (TPR) repeat protein